MARRRLLACVLLAALAFAFALPGLSGMFPMDRDEPRFAQATKQMLETGDFVNIRFQESARNKKPVGIYWLQAVSVAAGAGLGVPDARTAIWLYRIPSVLGMVATVLLTWWMALALASRRVAFAAALLMAPTLLLVAEAHLAKTDAVLTATVAATMAVLARAWVARDRDGALSIGLAGAFWTALAIGILVKGPITPLVAILACIPLAIRARSARWLVKLRPSIGVLWMLLLVLPWFILIVRSTGTAFFSDAIGRDMGAKLAAGQELHGAPPGAYFASFWLAGWPLAPFALLAAARVWRMRWSDPVFFLLAWLVPAWLLFEAVPTKLPHYVLPLYPALAVLSAWGAEQRDGYLSPGRWLRVAFSLLLTLPVALLPVAMVFATGRVTSRIDAATIAAAAVVVGVAGSAVWTCVHALSHNRPLTSTATAAVASLAICAFVFGWFLNPHRADLIALSPRLAQAGQGALKPSCAARAAYATVGDREPSLVFLVGTGLRMTDAAGAGTFLQGGPCRVAMVEATWEEAFRAGLSPSAPARLAARVSGLNINGGKKLDIGIYVRQEDAP